MSTITKQLIPLSYITEACNVSGNINEKEMKPNLIEAQAELRTILGSEFYEEIEEQYAVVNDTFTTDNAALYEGYIKLYLAWQAYFYSLGFTQLKSTPTGLRAFNDENSSLASDVQLFGLEKNVKRRAQAYRDMMIDYLRNEQSKDSTKFPLWDDNCKESFQFGISDISKTSDKVFSINKAVISNE